MECIDLDPKFILDGTVQNALHHRTRIGKRQLAVLARKPTCWLREALYSYILYIPTIPYINEYMKQPVG